MMSPEHVSGAENGTERVERSVERAWQKNDGAEAGRARSERLRSGNNFNGAGRGVNRPLTACSSLAIH